MRHVPLIPLLLLVLLAAPAQAQYGVEFTAPDTAKIVRVDSIAVYPVHIKNTGTTRDSFRIDLPRWNMPPNWGATFCDDHICYDPPFNITLNAGDTFPDHPHVSILAFLDPGTGWVVWSVRSWGDTTQYRELRFWCTATLDGVEQSQEVKGSGGQPFRPSPNPFTTFAAVPGHETERFAVYDVSGRKVGSYRADRIGEGLEAGVYFLKAEGKDAKPVRIVKLR